MRKWIGLFLMVLLLCGCTDKKTESAPESTAASDAAEETSPSVEATAPPEDVPQALTQFSLQGESCRGIAQMGQNYLLFGDEELTLCSGSFLTHVRTLTIEGLPAPDSGQVQIREDGVAYYDAAANAFVFLGNALEELGRIYLPEDLTGSACLSPDWRTVYYCTADAVRALDLTTGISRILKAQSPAWQTAESCMLNGTALRCSVTLENGTQTQMLLSTQTGEMLLDPQESCELYGTGQWYFAVWNHEPIREMIFGQVGAEPCHLWPKETEDACYPVLDCGGVVMMYHLEEGMSLVYYDLSTGMIADRLTLYEEEISWIRGDNSSVWICAGETLYHWMPALDQYTDETVYTQPMQTRENPDQVGLKEIVRRAGELEALYGVDILLGEEALEAMPPDYQFETEYLTKAYDQALPELARLLSQFPKSFYEALADWTDSGVVKIVLVRQIIGESVCFAVTESLQYYQEGEMYLVLQTVTDLESAFYHQLAHVMETPILSGSTACYEWNTLNPEGFQYDNDYEANLHRQDNQYLEGKDRAFIDLFSMSFAREDRCRIFEYACMSGKEAYFQSETMQKKLARICAGIREAFGLTGERYLWEQYLQTQ